MSRSYHVTKKQAIRALYSGDARPLAKLSEKRNVKLAERIARQNETPEGDTVKNSVLVAAMKAHSKKREADPTNLINTFPQVSIPIKRRAGRR